MNYQNKYIKYKTKYQKLKEKLNQKMQYLKTNSSNSLNQIGHGETRPDPYQEEKDRLIEMIRGLLESNPVVYMFITGKYASGKSTMTNRINREFNDEGVLTIELDQIVRDYVQDKTNPNQAEAALNAFNVYKGTASPEQTNIFVTQTKNIIEQGIKEGKRLILLEGALSSPDICRQIIGPNPLITVYFQPIDPELHKLRIVSRIKSDIANDTYSLPDYWGATGVFDREQMKADIDAGVDIAEKYKDKLDGIVKKYIIDAETRAQKIHTNFKIGNWVVITIHT